MEQKGSFIGFTFGNRHSSKLGIFRTSESGRYSVNLSPEMREKKVDLSTADGMYYFDSDYTQRKIPISFAFYGLTEEQTRQLKQVFNDKKIHPLILDEEPYKVWSAKLTETAICKHICFERDGQRFYCGEGNFTFTAFYPFARSRYEYIEDYTQENIQEWIDSNSLLTSEFEEGIIYPAILSYGYEDGENTGSIIGFEDSFRIWLEETDLLMDSNADLLNVNSVVEFFIGNGAYYNLEEWREASKIPSREEYGIYSQGIYKLYNAGDMDMSFKLRIPVNATAQTIDVHCGDSKILLNAVAAKVGDSYIIIDGLTHTIRGCDSAHKLTQNLYNEKITDGDFFTLPIGEIELESNVEGHLEFKYLYL